MVPEAINFLLNTILHIAPHSFANADIVPGSFPLPDFDEEALKRLKLTRKSVKGLQWSRPDLLAILSRDQSKDTQSVLNLLGTGFQLVAKFADLYKGLDGFVELYTPVLDILNGLSLDGFPEILTVGLDIIHMN